MGTLKIKKVDDKPMVIHTKKKAKIHMHEPKKAKIKGSKISPTISSATCAFSCILSHKELYTKISLILYLPKLNDL